MATRKNSAHIDRGAEAAKINTDFHDTVGMTLSLGFANGKRDSAHLDRA